STRSKSAAYVTIGEEDAATYAAISAGRHLEDIQARMTFRLLQKLMLKEEMAILAGNATLQLGTPATPVLSASGSGATLASATYSSSRCICDRMIRCCASNRTCCTICLRLTLSDSTTKASSMRLSGGWWAAAVRGSASSIYTGLSKTP